MHALFSDWYRVADPTATRDTVGLRWKATSEILDSLTKEQVAELAISLVRKRLEQPAWFKQAYKNHDEAMPTRMIEEELRVLMGIVLRLQSENDEEDDDGVSVSTVAALSLLTGAFGMKNEPDWLKEHLRASTESLSKAGRSVRQYMSPISVSGAFAAESVNDALSAAETRINIVTESNNYLWWAFTKHSRILNEAYQDLQPPVVAIAAAKDIVALSQNMPLAPEAETLLLYVLLDGRSTKEPELSFKNFISGLGKERAKKIAVQLPDSCAALCPISWAIAAAGDGRTWQSEFERTFEFKTTATFPNASAAIQFSRELSLARLLS